MSKANAKASPVARYHVLAGGRTTTETYEFIVIAKDSDRDEPFAAAMAYVFDRFKAKTSEDLPKPFNMTRIDSEDGYGQVKEVVFAERKRSRK